MTESDARGIAPSSPEPPEPSIRAYLGYGEALIAAALWGSSGIFAVHLFRLGVPPESVALLRPVVGVAALVAVALLGRRSLLRVRGKGLTALLMGGGLTVGAFQIAYQSSMDAVGVPTTVGLLYLAPPVVIAASGPLLGEWPTASRVGLALLTVAGVWLLTLGADEVEASFGKSGMGWGVLAGVSYAGYTLFGRWAAPRYGSMATVVYSTLGGCVLLAGFVPLVEGAPILPRSPIAWAVLIAFGLLTISVAQLLFFDALGRIEAGRAAVATTVEPVVAALLAAVLLGQGVSALGWTGLVLVVMGVAGAGTVGSTPGRERP